MKIAIISGKGGSGKSSVSAAFVALSETVIAVDCDVDASNLPLLFTHSTCAEDHFVSGYRFDLNEEQCVSCGLCVENCAFHALRMENDKPVVNPFFCEDCRLCERLCPTDSITLTPEARSSIYRSKFAYGQLIHGHLKPGDDNSGKMIARMREFADEVMKESHVSLQILDGPPGIGCPVISTITGIDRIVIVTEPTRSGLSDLQRACQVSASFCEHLFIIINKCDINDSCRKEILRMSKEKNIPVIAQLPFTKEIVEAQIQGKSIIDYAPHSSISEALRKAFTEICLS